RRQSDVCDDGNLFVNKPSDNAGTIAAAFELYGLGTAVFHQSKSVLYTLILADMIRAVRHIGDDHGTFCSALNSDTGGRDLVERNRDRIPVPVDHIAHTVADEDDV